jgi:hypothetical protein
LSRASLAFNTASRACLRRGLRPSSVRADPFAVRIDSAPSDLNAERPVRCRSSVVLYCTFFLTRRSSAQYACMRCTPGELRRCLFWHQAAPYPNAIFVAFVRDPLSHDSRRFAFRLVAEPFGSALFLRNPVGCVALVRDVRRFFFEPLFWRLSNRRPAMHFWPATPLFFSWSLAQDHFRCWTCPGAFPGRVRRRRGRTARTCGLTLFFPEASSG